MHGAGISPDITTDRPYPVLLDVTRLVSRVGRGPLTGVDRVELAYLDWGLATPAPLFCLARISGGYVLLDRAGIASFRDRLRGTIPWGPRDLRAMVGIRTPKARGAAEADLRRLSAARSGKIGVPEIPISSAVYLNTGHSNLGGVTLPGLAAQGLKIAVLVHDMIPLDWPDFQRPGSVAGFETRMRDVARHADLVIANSDDTQRRVLHHFRQWGAPPATVSAHLGLHPLPATPASHVQNRPYYVAIGTIEPRKNHALLLDIWEDMAQDRAAEDLPHLHIVGQRGWNNDAVFRRLDALQGQPWLHQHADMDDARLTALLGGAHGLVFPSFAEGFGLPSLEAARLGVPVICGDLAIHREVLGDYPVYADLQDRYLWKKTIISQAEQRQEDLIHAHKAKSPVIPTWAAHFSAVNAAVTKLF